MQQSEGDLALSSARSPHFLISYSEHPGILRYQEEQALGNADVARGPWIRHFPSERLNLLAFATCMAYQSQARYQYEASASISGAQTNHTYSHQQQEYRGLQHNGHGAAQKQLIKLVTNLVLIILIRQYCRIQKQRVTNTNGLSKNKKKNLQLPSFFET